jgi:hypothetical protein
VVDVVGRVVAGVWWRAVVVVAAAVAFVVAGAGLGLVVVGGGWAMDVVVVGAADAFFVLWGRAGPMAAVGGRVRPVAGARTGITGPRAGRASRGTHEAPTRLAPSTPR